MRKNKLLLLLALLMTAATGAWADVTWSFSDGTLTISGTGAMEDYTKASNHPWYTHKTNITSIVVEDGVTHIGNYAFQVYTNVTSISLPTSLTSIGTSAFQGCSNAALTSITIPENVTTIGQGAFQACSSLTTVTIPDKVTTIGNSAFSSCTGLTSVNIPNSVETIGQMAFRACTGLTSVTIGNSVTSIGNNAFNACSNLATVTVKAPSCTLGTTAFDGCTSLTAIYVPSGKVDTYKGAENWSNYATYIQGDPNAEPSEPTGYTVSLKDGVKDADKWTIKSGETTVTPGVTEVAEGATVTLTYTGTKHVKSVKAVKKADNAYLKWNADQKKLVATDIPATANKVQNSDENVTWAGIYVVEDDVTINGEIKLTGDVELIIKDGAKLTVNKIIHTQSGASLSVYGQTQMSGELNVTNQGTDAIFALYSLAVHSCKVKATSPAGDGGGVYNTTIVNVYGGSLDAEYTGEGSGHGIILRKGGVLNIYGGEVKAVGKGNHADYSYGIKSSSTSEVANVKVYGGKLWAECADNKAFRQINLTTEAGFTGKIETSGDGSSWTEHTSADMPETKYVRVGY